MTRLNRNLFWANLTWAAAACLAAPMSAVDVQLAAVQFPDNKTVDLPLAPTTRVAPAFAEAEVRYRNGQAQIEVSYKKLPPALLFSGDVTSYVVWVVARDGATENLGELIVRSQSGKAEYRTGQKEFGLLITAEAYPLVLKPSELVIFTSIAPPPKKASSTPITLSSFQPLPRMGNPTIGSMEYSGKESLDLIQAQNVLQQAQQMGAEKYAPDAMRDANTSLAQATNSFKDRQNRQGVDYARRSVAQASAAIRTTQQKEAEAVAAAAAAARAAQLQSAQQQAADAQQAALASREQALAAREQAAKAQQQMTLLQQQAAVAQQEAAAAQERAAAAGLSAEAADAARRDADAARQRAEQATAEASAAAATFAAQKSELETRVGQSEAELAKLRAERNDLESRLSGALSEVAQISQSARGVVVNLPDILFDTNKATLKQNAQVALAKLAGIVSLFPNINLRIEGHTDSTGGDAINVPLSRERAQSVMDFLNSQGVASTRMKAEGYAARIPVADNSTPAGRSKNRRVEIILAEGVIAPAGN